MSITIERVQQGYEKAGITPIRGNFIRLGKEDQEQCGCAITALLMTECGKTFHEVHALVESEYMDAAHFEKEVAKLLDIDYGYVRNFINGYDSSFELKVDVSDRPGFMDGRNAAIAMGVLAGEPVAVWRGRLKLRNFISESRATNWREENQTRYDSPLYVDEHPKDGWVVYLSKEKGAAFIEI